MIQYSLESISEDGRSFVFTGTAIENISPGWRARETYRFLTNDEFIETFALAGPLERVRDLFGNPLSSETVKRNSSF